MLGNGFFAYHVLNCRNGAPTCGALRATMRPVLLSPPLCWSCRAVAGRGRPLCDRCRRRLRPLAPLPPSAGVWAALEYEGPARALVGALKFRGGLGLADPMAALMAAAVPPERLRGALVPVPLHPARRRKRGFNQAERLARALGRRTGLQVVDCLVREGSSLRQVGRGRAARLAGPGRSISVRGPVPPRAVLVDDVITTGATLAACAAALRAAGSDQVGALVFARTLGR
jgi:ComF family protein